MKPFKYRMGYLCMARLLTKTIGKKFASPTHQVPQWTLAPECWGSDWCSVMEAGNYQGVVRVLKFEGRMLVYDPQTNGAGWVAMRGIPSSLTEVESRSTNDLGNFYSILSTEPEGPKVNQSPSGKSTVEYKQSGNPIAGIHGGRVR